MKLSSEQCGVIIVGAGLAGLVAASEALDAGLRVRILDQENRGNLGGQAYWFFGGLFLVDTPEQRRLGVRDSFDLAWSDWQHSAQFDRLDDEDLWAQRWAKAYVEFAATEKRSWIKQKGIDLTPVVGWAERGDGRAEGHGNSRTRINTAINSIGPIFSIPGGAMGSISTNWLLLPSCLSAQLAFRRLLSSLPTA